MSEKNVRVLNDLELSGGLTFTNNLSGFPENPKPRTLVVKGGVPYLYTELVDGSGYFSWTPIGYRQGAYVHSQGVASTLWTVSHNFNTVNFGYFVYDANHKMVVANVNVVDANTIQIELSEAITGTAVIFSTESIFAGVLSASTEVSLGNITLRDAGGVLTVNNNAVAMKAALDAETAARTAADSAMSARIDDVVSNIDPAALDSLAEVVAAFQNTQGDVAASLANLSSSASSALADEISRATTAELTIASDLAAEVTRAQGAESALASQIAAASYTLPAATASTLGGVKQGTNITIAADGTISAQTSAAAAGALTGSTLSANVTSSSLTSVGTLGSLTVTNPIVGSVTGSSSSTTGNAATATKLESARLINGVAFDGTSDITISASSSSTAAADLTGSTLSANVTASSLTSVGTLGSLDVTNAVTAGSLTAGNITVSGDTIVSSNPTITIDPTTTGVGGLVVIAGNLQVTGTTTTINSTTVTTSELNIEIAKDAANASAANGAGLTVAGAGATLTYASSTDSWNMNKSLVVPSATVGGQPVGYLTVPQNAQGAYTLVLADSGKHIFTSVGGVTWTIPANASVAFPIGTAVTFVNQSAATCSIAITSDSMYLAGAGTLGTRTLAAYGMATAIKVSATSWMISGNLT